MYNSFMPVARTFALPALLLLALLSGCATERYVPPALSDGPRPGMGLSVPVLGAVVDTRTERQPADAAAELQADLARIYGSTFEWNQPTRPTPLGRVSVRVTISQFGAFYGKRLISLKEYTDSLSLAHEQATRTWEPVLAAVTGRQYVVAGYPHTEGWWNGIARIDLDIEDNRGKFPVRFILPVVAEHREAGRGSASGDQAALTAWQGVSARLLAALDAVVLVMREEQPQ